MPNVSLTAPGDYQIQAAEIDRRRKYAEMLQQQALEPEQTQMAGGWAVRTPWTAQAAKLAKALAGASGQDAATQQQLALAQQMRSEDAKVMQRAIEAMQGTPERTLGSNDPGDAPISYPAQPGNPQAAYGIMAQSNNPAIQQMAMGQMFKSLEPYTLGKDAVRYGPGNVPLASNIQPNFKPVETVGPTGLPVTSFVDMNKPPAEPMAKPVENVYQTLGGVTQAVPKYGPAPATLQHTQTPDSVASIQNSQTQGELNRAVTMRGQNMTNARAMEQNAIVNNQRQNTASESIRKEFESLPEVKNYKQVLPIIESVQRAPNTPAGDIDLIYGVGKVMDPNSVVREGELNLVIKAGSPLQRFQGWANYVKGGGRLAPQQRAELMQIMQSRVGALQNQYSAARNAYTGIAQKQQIDPNMIFVDLPSMASKPGTPAPAGVDPTAWAHMTEQERALFR